MDGNLRLLFLALREGLIDPARLAAEAAAWPSDPPSTLGDFLVARGVLTPDQCRRLEKLACPPSTATVTIGPVTTPTADHGPPANGSALDHDARPPLAGGRYRVAALHRTGGLGRVWRVTDAALGRDVALKDLHPHRAADPRMRARFVEEARITGQLEHPCVVPVYDLIDGPNGPCYTMRFVAGRTLAEAVRDYHTDRAAGKADPLALAGLLDAFVAVCRAVAYAHARNVLHRDLKGQNIILGEYGEVFVLDWGLAKVAGDGAAAGPAGVTPTPDPTGAREETASGAVLGTPAFMAPELAGGAPASAASDVYALGAVLYAILTGRAPYEGDTVVDILSRVQSAEPLPPRVINPACPQALEAVCRKAMARDPADRYPSAEAVAADVRRWRADEPVAAYPEPWAARAARWSRRHRAAVLGAAAVLLTAVFGLAVSTALVWQEEQRTREQKDLADRARERAEVRQALASDLSKNLLNLSEKRLAAVPQAEAARRGFLLDALKPYRRALAQQPDDPDLQAETARLARYAANLHRLAGQTDEADASYREAVRLYEALAAARPDDVDTRNLLVETRRDQSQLFVKKGQLGAAAATLGRVVAEAERLPDEYRLTLATAVLDLSGVQYSRGEFPAAAKSAGRAADLFRQLLAGPPDRRPQYARMYVGMATTRKAAVERERGDKDAALAADTAAVNLFREMPEADRDRNEQHMYARALEDRGRTHATRGDWPQAEQDFTAAIAVWEALKKLKPGTPFYREWLSAAYEGRGRARTALKQYGPAADDLGQSRALAEQLIGENTAVPGYRERLGRACTALGRLAAARGDDPGAADWLAQAAAALRAAAAGEPENALVRRALDEVETERATAGRDNP